MHRGWQIAAELGFCLVRWRCFSFFSIEVFCYSIEAENLGWIESKQNEQIKMANDQESGCISPG